MTHLSIQPEVADALHKGRGVVALESTIIAHGMPYPQNIETALSVEATVRTTGAVPATIAIIGGVLRVGLTHDELERLGTPATPVLKCSRRDIPVAVAQQRDGATTVAATMVIAEMAHIEVFATGGIGGVHYGAGQTFDVSADLQELAQTRVAVVTAGAKAIVDIGLTLEYLETHGVPVIGYGTDAFPAFYVRDSGYSVDYRVDDAVGAALLIRTKQRLGLKGGMVIANPVPEEYALDRGVIDEAIHRALQEAADQGVTGKHVTPFLLSRIEDITGGESLKTNVALVRNNARVAGAIAVELAGTYAR